MSMDTNTSSHPYAAGETAGRISALTKIAVIAASLGAAAVLSACGGNEKGNAPLAQPPGASLCRAIGGGGYTVVYSAAMGAQFSQPNNVFDADFTTFTVLDTPNGTGTSSIRGVQQPGLLEPAGEVAGVLLSSPAMIAATEITISTYMDSTQQDSAAAGVTTMAGDAKTTGVNYFYGLKTTKPFNSIQVSLALKNDPVQVNLFELCVQK